MEEKNEPSKAITYEKITKKNLILDCDCIKFAYYEINDDNTNSEIMISFLQNLEGKN